MSPRFKELDIAELAYDLVDDGMLYPKGTIGTIVYVYNNGEAYELEVSTPIRNVLTVSPEDIDNHDKL